MKILFSLKKQWLSYTTKVKYFDNKITFAWLNTMVKCK